MHKCTSNKALQSRPHCEVPCPEIHVGRACAVIVLPDSDGSRIVMNDVFQRPAASGRMRFWHARIIVVYTEFAAYCSGLPNDFVITNPVEGNEKEYELSVFAT